MKTFLFIALQYIAPQHLISRVAGWLANTKIDWLKSLFIEKFIAVYGVNMEEAERPLPASYACFNEFFCRSLKPGARLIDSSPLGIASPADGTFSQVGNINTGRIFQAKGRGFSTVELLGGDKACAEHFNAGSFATIYLSPKDYHRLHMPLDGTLISMTHIPGNLFSVNPSTVENVDKLFARNERVVCLFQTTIGPVALVLVGAMIVASIDTTWAGHVAPVGKAVSTYRYNEQSIAIKKGEEFARFKLGSTIVMLFPRDTITWNSNIAPLTGVRMGESIASINAS